MTLLRTGAAKIRTGTQRVIQPRAPQRVMQATRRAAPQPEIAFIAEAKKLEQAKAKQKDFKDLAIPEAFELLKGGSRSDRLLYLAEQGFDRVGLVAYFKELGGAGKGETGYIATKILAGDMPPAPRGSWKAQRKGETSPAPTARSEWATARQSLIDKLPGPVRAWYDAERALTNKILDEAKKKAQKKIKKLKASGKDYTRLTINRIYINAYPNWSDQDKRAKESYASHKAYAQHIEAWRSNLEAIQAEKGDWPAKTITATAAELEKAEAAKAEAGARGWSCYAQIEIYKVKTRDGQTILVEAFDKKSAEAKAKQAGYKPAWVTKKLATDTPPKKKLAAKIEPGTTQTLKGKEIPREWRMADSDTQASMGIKKVNGQYQQTMIATAEGQFIPKAVYDALPDNYQSLIVKQGMAAYQKQAEADRAKFQDWLKELKQDYPDLYDVYEKQGYDALQNAITGRNAKQQDVISTLDKKYKLDQGYNITAALSDKAVTASDLRLAGFKDDDISTAAKTAKVSAEYWQNLEKDFLKVPAGPRVLEGAPGIETQHWYIHEKAWLSNYEWPEKPYKELSKEQQRAVLEYYSHTRPEYWAEQAKIAGKFALAFVPVAGTIHYWNEMEPWQRTVSIIGDIACFTFVLHGATAAARATKAYTAAGRIRAAAKGAAQAVLAEAVAPIDMAAHPIATAKGIGRQVQSTIETLLHPKKLPLGATELAYTTTRLPARDVGGARKAMELRDAAVAAAIKGKPGRATIGDITLELTPAELQKVGGPLAVHATPDVRPYLNGAVVQGGAEGSGMFISPNFHSRFAMATAFGDMPEGGIKGGLLIRDQKVLNALAPTRKTYMSTVEIEALLKPGTTLPAPSQILFTRDIAGNKLTFLVIGKPYTQAEIAKLKFLGSLDTMAQVFRPTVRLTGAERTAIEAMDDIIELAQERAALARQLEAARAAGRADTIKNLNQRISKVDDQIDNLIKRVNAPREAIRPDNLLWAQYAAKGLLERYRELNPKGAQRTARGTRLPDVRPAMALRGAVPLMRGRLTGKEPYVSLVYKKGPAPGYAPGYAASYVPGKTLPYSPAKLLPKPPAPTPPYTPSRVTPARPGRVSVSKVTTKPPARKPVIPMTVRREKIPTQPARLVSWRQGAYFITLVPPFRTTGTKPDVVFSRSKPPHAKVATGKRSPQKTLLSIGKVPKLITLPMGATRARVRHGSILRFTRSGVIKRGRRRR